MTITVQPDRIGIWCEVWGGITGSRQSWMQSDGELEEFASWDDAENAAKELNKSRNGPYARASFRYTARRLPERAA